MLKCLKNTEGLRYLRGTTMKCFEKGQKIIAFIVGKQIGRVDAEKSLVPTS